MDQKDFDAAQNRSHFHDLDRIGDEGSPHPDDVAEANAWNEHFRQNHK